MCRQMKDDVGVGQQCISEAQAVVENCLFLASFSNRVWPHDLVDSGPAGREK